MFFYIIIYCAEMLISLFNNIFPLGGGGGGGAINNNKDSL